MYDALEDISVSHTSQQTAHGHLSVVDALQQTQASRRRPTYDALVLDARLRQSLVTVRSLGERGMNVAALEITKTGGKARNVPTFSSRWCQRAYSAPAFDQHSEAFLAYIQQLLDYTGARVLISSSDGTIALIRAHRQELERRTRIALAKESALEAAINKKLTLEIAGRLGIGVPRGVRLHGVDEVAAAIREIGLPAVVKPVESWLWGEQRGVRLICHLATTLDEARRAVAELTQHGGSVLFQQFLTGKREAVSLLHAHGEIYARFAQWAKRTQPPLGGTSTYRQSIALPDDIGAQAEQLVREIELEGYAEVEFRRDALGKPYLMEINPRLSASIEVAVRAGVDFPHLLYQWTSRERIERVKNYRTGVWMRYLEGDLLTTMQTIAQRGRPGVIAPGRAVFEFASAFFIPSGYDYVHWKDPLPAWTAAMEAVQRVRKRLEGS